MKDVIEFNTMVYQYFENNLSSAAKKILAQFLYASKWSLISESSNFGLKGMWRSKLWRLFQVKQNFISISFSKNSKFWKHLPKKLSLRNGKTQSSVQYSFIFSSISGDLCELSSNTPVYDTLTSTDIPRLVHKFIHRWPTSFAVCLLTSEE